MSREKYIELYLLKSNLQRYFSSKFIWIIEINSMSHSDTTLMAPMELNQLLQFHNLEMTEESLLSLFPKLIRINEVCRVTVLLLTLFPNVNFRNDSST